MPVLALIKTEAGYQIADPSTSFSAPPADCANVIFLVAGPSQQVIQAALEKVLIVAQDLDDGLVRCCTPPPGADYVYAYFDAPYPQNWSNTFYIGKGCKDRYFSHVKDRFSNAKKAEPKAAKNNKQKKIDTWLSNLGGLPRNNAALKQIAEGELVSAIYGDLSTVEAFFIEQFLIKRARRAQDVTNDTAGNNKSGKYTSLCQPKIFTRTNPVHSAIWNEAVYGL